MWLKVRCCADILVVVVCCGVCGAQAAGQAAAPTSGVAERLAIGTEPAAAVVQVGAVRVAAPAQQAQPSRLGGSLLKSSLAVSRDPNKSKVTAVSFFAVPEPEPRTIKKHDLIQIIVREESSFSSQGSTDLKKEADINAQIETFVNLQKLLKGQVEGDDLNNAAIKAAAERNFKGEGSVDRSDTMTLRVTAEVIDVKPNDTLVLQARKFIQNDEEEKEILLTGVCRAQDVTADNSVLSTQLADVELRTKHKGAVKDTTKRGWIPKLVDAVNPF